MELKVVEYPEEILSSKAVLVENPAEVVDLIETMWKVVEKENGVGLAANQIGDPRAVAIINNPYDDDRFVMINPVITGRSDTTVSKPEGCLSLKGIQGNVMRHTSVEVTFLDESGEEVILHADGRTAHIIQHEVDHLNGMVYIDHYDENRRNVMVKKYNRKRG